MFTEDGSNFLQPTELIEKGGVKLGVIGICAMIVDKVMRVKMSDGLKFTLGLVEVPEYIKKLKADGADLTLLLSHNGFPQDVELLKRINGIDICLSAHTHNRIYSSIEVNGARIVQCGCHGAFIGNITIDFHANKSIAYNNELIKVNSSLPKNLKLKVASLVEHALKPADL